MKFVNTASALRLIAGFAAIFFWVSIRPVGDSVINQPTNTWSEIMVRHDSVDKAGFTQLTQVALS